MELATTHYATSDFHILVPQYYYYIYPASSLAVFDPSFIMTLLRDKTVYLRRRAYVSYIGFVHFHIISLVMQWAP